MLTFNNIHALVLTEKFYTYKMPEDKSLVMYDFYVLDYLNNILDKPSASFRELPIDLKDSVTNAVKNLYPALREELLEAVFFSVCAEFRHVNSFDYNKRVFDKPDKYKKLFILWSRYMDFHKKGTDKQQELIDLYNIEKPSSEKRPPETEKYNNTERLLSYKAAEYAIQKSGLTRSDFMEMCGIMFREGRWNSNYGGEAWAGICDGWILLYNADTINPNLKSDISSSGGNSKLKNVVRTPMNVAIDHVYDLQHNTDTVLNKLKSYYKDGYSWIKKALDHKRDITNYYELLNYASGTVKSMAIPILYNKLGQTWEDDLKKKSIADEVLQKQKTNYDYHLKLAKNTEYEIGDKYNEYDYDGELINSYLISDVRLPRVTLKSLKNGKVETYHKSVLNMLIMKSQAELVKNPNPSSIKPKESSDPKVRSEPKPPKFKIGDYVLYPIVTGSSNESAKILKIEKKKNGEYLYYLDIPNAQNIWAWEAFLKLDEQI